VSRTFEGETLCSLFERNAAEGGGRVALRAAGVELTWDDYAQRVRSLATRWSRVGVEPGAPVVLMLHNSPDFHVATHQSLAALTPGRCAPRWSTHASRERARRRACAHEALRRGRACW
jgi:acyl-CoA synthetase (AMP-forming)/AMP-acid ligase II